MRPAHTYRAALRNEVKAKRQLPIWRETVAAKANERADLHGRAIIANAAREAAASVEGGGMRSATHRAAAMLAFYRTVKRTRPVARIIRELEAQVRDA